VTDRHFLERSVIYLFIVSLIWAFSFGLIKWHLAGQVDAVVISTIRLGLSLLVFLPFWRPRRVGRALAGNFMLIGAIQFGLMYLAYIYSYQFFTASHNIAILTIFTPLLVTLLADVLNRRLVWAFLAGALLAIVGAAVIEYRAGSRYDLTIGVLLVQTSNLAFAMGQVWYRRIRLANPTLVDREVFGWLYVGGVAVCLLALPWMADLSRLPTTATQWAVLGYLGVVASGVAFFLWNYGATKVSTGVLAVANNLKIPLAVAVSLLVFGETADLPRLLIGGALIAAGLGMNEIVTRRRHRSQSLAAPEPS
jgi:drug/metabolite transporter (DMT)-like permease